MKKNINTFAQWLGAITCDKGGQPSSKRIIALTGMAVVIALYIYCTITRQQMLDITEYLVGSFVVLLGIDPATSIFTNKQTTTE